MPVPVSGKPQTYIEPNRRRWLTRSKIKLTRESTGFTLEPATCSQIGNPDELEIFVRRRGTECYTLKYTVFDRIPSGGYEIRLDRAFLELPTGRYEFSFARDCAFCGSIEVELCDDCKIGQPKVNQLEGKPAKLFKEEPEGVSDIFNDIYECEFNLCTVMEADDTTVPLSKTDLDKLCAIVLCRPVQLVIHDGTKSETVEFAGCLDGKAVVTRCVNGGTPIKFPAGATMEFSWTPANVVAAVEGC